MWFRNLQVYLLTAPFEFSAEELHDRLLTKISRKCGSLEMSTLGWERPLGRNGTQLTHATAGCIMICARREEKVLPPAVIRERLTEKVDALEETEKRRAGRRERQEIRDEIVQDLLPRAFTRSALTYAYIDIRNRWLVIDAASVKKAEELISLLRETLGTLPLRPLQVNQAPTGVMTAWLKSGGPPGDFQIQDECELRDRVEEGGVVRCRRQNLEGSEIKTHLDAGKQLVQLSLEWHERLGFLLTEELSIKRLRFLEVIQEEAAQSEAEDAATRFDLDFSLMTLELGRFIPRLIEVFGGLAEELAV